jgi:flavin-dependent dehydrogenase
MHDLAVVGAGPAGLAVAIGAARVGLDTVVLERRSGVIDKACGEGLMPGALATLQALGVDPPGHPISGITYRQGDTCAQATFRRGPGRGVRRTDLHAALTDAARGYGIAISNANVGAVEQHADHVDVAGTKARYLVAADGLHSAVRTQVGLADGVGKRLPKPRWGQRRHYRVAPWTDMVEVTYAADSECYVTPIADDVVGVAVLSSTKGGFADQLAAFPTVCARLRDAEAVSDVRGAGPLRQPVRTRTAGRVLLAGDAAGYVDALTGEGLAVSFAAAAQLVRCLLADRPGDYERAWARVSRRSRWITGGLLWARNQRLLGPRIVPAAAAAPRLFGVAVDQLAR